MAFTGVHHQHAHAARAIQQRLDRRDRRAQAADVHAGLVGVSAQRAEVALHVDHQQRRMLEEQRVRRQAHSANSLHTAAAMPSTMSWASRWPFAALEPLAETAPGGRHPFGTGGVHVVGRKVGRGVVGNLLQRDQLRMEMQHQRGLDHRGMLQRETGKAFREDVGQGLLVAEIPVLQAHHLQPGVRPEVAQRQLDASATNHWFS